MRFIFTGPAFLEDKNKAAREYYISTDVDSFTGNEFEIRLRNEMRQSHIAKECAEWLSKKAQIKSFKKLNIAQPRLISIKNKDDSLCINGTVDFTTDGLGITNSTRIDSNLCVYGNELTKCFLKCLIICGMMKLRLKM